MRRVRNHVLLVVTIVLALSACASSPDAGGGSQVGKQAQITHIHGLGVDASGTLYVATHHGLIKQEGAAWVYASADTNDHMGFSLHAADGVMYRSGHSPSKPSLGVESSTDGARWTHLSDVAEPPVDFHAMAVSYADSKTLWGWDSGGRGTFRSTDGGSTWTAMPMRGIERQIYALAAPASADVVLAGTPSGLYRSRDAGSTWTPFKDTRQGWVIGVAADPKDAEHILAATERGLKFTADGGKTWAVARGGLPPGAELSSIAISPIDGEIAYAADSTNIFTTTDGGKTWTSVMTG